MAIKTDARITKEHFEDAKKFAYGLLDNLDGLLVYHRKQHTTEIVVPAILRIAKDLLPEDRYITTIAGAFHDTGFLIRYNENENVGALIAISYMKESKKDYSEKHLQIVRDTILNTDMKSPPKNIYEKIMRDADLAYLGEGKNFIRILEGLRKETMMHHDSPLYKKTMTQKLWGELSLKFMESHKWFTEEAKELYEKNKEDNISILKSFYRL